MITFLNGCQNGSNCNNLQPVLAGLVVVKKASPVAGGSEKSSSSGKSCSVSFYGAMYSNKGWHLVMYGMSGKS